MATVSIGRIAVDQTAYHFDKPFDYIIPEEMTESAQPGCRVLVPFGNGSGKRQGMILSRFEGESGGLKAISAVLDSRPILSEELLRMVPWMQETTFCTLYDAVKLMLPVGINLKIVACYAASEKLNAETVELLEEPQAQVARLLYQYAGLLAEDKIAKRLSLEPEICKTALQKLERAGLVIQSQTALQKIGDASVKMVRLTEGAKIAEENGSLKLTVGQKSVFRLLGEIGSASVREVCYFTGVSVAVLNTMNKKGLTEFYETAVSRSHYAQEPEFRTDPAQIRLTEEQEQAFRNLKEQAENGGGISLLYGVTGSGKTSVFLKLIHETVEAGKNVILMVPEISLTPQLIQLFRQCFGAKIAVFHSALSLGERMDEWKRVRDGQAKIVIGTRSAVFAPFREVGLIVMDEEQESSYKSESAPRYHARDVARFRCRYHGGLLVLSSATPSVESFYYAQKGRYTLNRLTKRYGKAQLPEVQVVDMTQEPAKGSDRISEALADELEENLREKRQSILLLNRRGYQTFVSCRKCGEVLSCPNCSISLTYHTANRRLMCHYCGHSVPLTAKCPYCGEEAIRYGGEGTQKIEEELEEMFPEARILRMDADTTMARFSHEEKLGAFAAGKYDILIGTQMVAKGLNFPNVTLVGVLSSDQALYSDDFRSYERAFSLLTQVVGRSGRSVAGGKALIQTMTPENPVIQLAAEQDYDAFYRDEIAVREARLYPPFSDLCVIGFVGTEEPLVKEAAAAFLESLRELAQGEYPQLPMRVIGPAPASVVRVSGKYRYKLLIKCRNSAPFREMTARLLRQYGRERKFAKITVYADMNPDNIL